MAFFMRGFRDATKERFAFELEKLLWLAETRRSTPRRKSVRRYCAFRRAIRVNRRVVIAQMFAGSTGKHRLSCRPE
jgi:hypothetical protein